MEEEDVEGNPLDRSQVEVSQPVREVIGRKGIDHPRNEGRNTIRHETTGQQMCPHPRHHEGEVVEEVERG
ncbi:MAG: hypothetical protein D6795_01280, partial [Deltaproteobacteria bacterium]